MTADVERIYIIGSLLPSVVHVKMVFNVIAFNLCQLCTLKNAKVILALAVAIEGFKKTIKFAEMLHI